MLNPDRNLFSVAPVGNNVIIGRHMALKGGLSRENVINLIAWLTVAANAKPKEIAEEIQKAQMPIPVAVPVKAPTVDLAKVLPYSPPVLSFLGKIDPEEAAAIEEAVKLSQTVMEETKPIEVDSLTRDWEKIG